MCIIRRASEFPYAFANSDYSAAFITLQAFEILEGASWPC